MVVGGSIVAAIKEVMVGYKLVIRHGAGHIKIHARYGSKLDQAMDIVGVIFVICSTTLRGPGSRQLPFSTHTRH